MLSRFILVGFVLFANSCFATSSYSTAKEAGKNVGRVGIGKAQAALSGGLEKNHGQTVSVGNAIGFQGTEVPEKNLTDSQMDTESKRRFANANDESDDKALNAAKKSALKSMNFKIDKNSTFLDKAKHAQKHPEEHVDWLIGKYADCEHKIEEGTKYNVFKTCDIFTGISDQLCKIGRAIQVDAKHDYECYLERKTFPKTCIKKFKVSYEQGEADCNNFKVTSASRGITHNYVYPNLVLRAANHVNYTHSVLSYAGELLFNINDTKTINKVMLSTSHVGPIVIYLNNNVIYSFPTGTQAICLGSSQCNISGRDDDGCSCTYDSVIISNEDNLKDQKYLRQDTQLNGIPHCPSPPYTCRGEGHGTNAAYDSNRYLKDIDITAHLKQGANEIKIRSAVSWRIEGHANQLTLQFKNQCIVEQSTWEETCS